MAFTTVTVSIDSILQNAGVLVGSFRMRLSSPTFSDTLTNQCLVVPVVWQSTNFTQGTASLDVIPNCEIADGSYYKWEIWQTASPCNKILASGDCVVPPQNCDLIDITDIKVTEGTLKSYASSAKQSAESAARSAQEAADILESCTIDIESAGSAQIAAIEETGRVQGGYIESAGSAQINLISNAGDAQLGYIASAGEYQVAQVNSTGSAQINAINETAATQGGYIVSAGDAQVLRVGSAGDNQVAIIESTGAAQVILVESAGNAQKQILIGEGSAQTQAIDLRGDFQIGRINSAGNSYISQIAASGGYQINQITSAGGNQVSLVNSAGQAQGGYIVSAGDAQIQAIVASGGYQVGLVESAGQAQIDAITSAGSAYASGIAQNAAAISALQAKTDATNHDVDNIQELLKGNLYSEQTDSTVAYTKTVPSGALPWAEMGYVGGRTLVWNQLVARDKATTFNSDYVSFDSTTDTYTVTYAEGSASSGVVLDLPVAGYSSSHKYFIYFNADFTSYVGMRFYFPAESSYATNVATLQGIVDAGGVILTGGSNSYLRVSKASATTDAQSCSFKVRVVDLTLMFGAGNEPASVADYIAMFPNMASESAYNAGTLMSAGVTQMVSKDSSNNVLGTYPVPAEVQALPGYGWSAGSAYNYVDFDRKVFVQNVGSVDLGTLTFGKPTLTYSGTTITIFVALSPTDAKRNGYGLCQNYVSSNKNNYGQDLEFVVQNDKSIWNGSAYYSITSLRIIFHDESKNDLTAAEFKTAMSGVMLYYELATPIETDISAYLTDESPYTEVEAGGSITFENSNGSDYRIPVPTAITYDIDLQGAL